jgi:hypothetical protein
MSLKFGLGKMMFFLLCAVSFPEEPGMGCRARGRRLSPLALLSTVETFQR